MKKFTIVIGILFLQLSLFAQIPTNGLIGHWSFTGNALDESGNGNNGTVNGATLTTDRFGNENSAYSFDGNDWIEVSDNNSLHFTTNEITVSVWFKKSSLTTGEVILQKQSGIGSTQSGINLGFTANTLEIAGIVGAGAPLNLTISNSSEFINSEWHHFVYTFVNVTGSIFVDNLEIATSVVDGSFLGNNTENLIFGYGLPLNNWFYNGELDDIRIYNRVLTEEEITSLYNESLCYETITVTDTLIINANITGYNPVTFNNTIKVYPNPASDHIFIDVDDNSMGYELKIINTLSQVVFETSLSQSQYNIDLNTWTGNGTYFVQFYNANGNLIDVKKIIIQ